MKYFLGALMVIAVLSPIFSRAQTAGQDKEREKVFLYEVKVIDEFIERFNDDTSSALRMEYKKDHRKYGFSRKDLISSLFNHPKSWAANGDEKKFLEQVTDTANPQYLRFNDSNWYAETKCVFTFKGRRLQIPLILQVKTDESSISKWMITGIGESPIFKDTTAGSSAKTVEKSNAKNSIPPSDYATNFLELHRIFTPSINALNYFTPELLATTRAQRFVGLIKDNTLKFEFIENTKFHFYQINNYCFVVERFVRAETNSGWLITNLKTATKEEKKAKKEQLLQRPL